MNGYTIFDDKIFITLLTFVALSLFGLIITLTLYYLKTSGFLKPQRKPAPNTSQRSPIRSIPNPSEVRDYDTNEIFSTGRFTAAAGKLEYRTLAKSTSGVIDGGYSDLYQGNESHNGSFRG